MFNDFLLTYADILNRGITKLTPIIIFITTTFAIIDFLLTLIFQYNDDLSKAVTVFIRKIFGYTFVLAISRYFATLVDEAIKLVFAIGYNFFPSDKVSGARIGNLTTPNFDSIYDDFMYSIVQIEEQRMMLDGLNIGTHLLMLLIMVLALFSLVLILKEIIVQYIKVKAMATIGFFLVPLNTFEQTKSMGRKLFSALFTEIGVLLTSVCLTGITLTVLSTRSIPQFNANTVAVGDAMAWVFLLGICAYLVTQSKEIGNMLMNGTAVGKGSGALAGMLSKAVGVGASVVGGAVVGASMLKEGLKSAKNSDKTGKEKFKDVLSGMKEGRDRAKNSRLAKVGKKIESGAQKTIQYASGQRGIESLAGDVLGGAGGMVSDQIFHNVQSNSEKEQQEMYQAIKEWKNQQNTEKVDELKTDKNTRNNNLDIQNNDFNNVENNKNKI